jgi:hypothetical protein
MMLIDEAGDEPQPDIKAVADSNQATYIKACKDSSLGEPAQSIFTRDISNNSLQSDKAAFRSF